MSIKEKKKKIREVITKQRDELSERYRLEASEIVREKLLESIEYKDAKTIMTFVSFSSEIDTRKLIEKAWDENKKIVTPLAKLKERRLELYYIESWDQLQAGVYGILEPIPDEGRLVCASQIDLVIYPGVAFDNKLNRLGYGGGFYDRFFSRLRKDCNRIAITYDMQVIESVPTDEYDIPVDKVITEKRELVQKN